MEKIQPAIKWSGSKRSQAQEILSYFPKEINTYYEPFCGGASILGALLVNEHIKVKNYVCSDINQDLINLWNNIKYKPTETLEHYQKLWHEMNCTNKGVQEKKDFYNLIREQYNKYHDPKDFMFIMRTTVNGMPRYNKNGIFNSPFHITRNGIEPHRLGKIVNYWSQLLNQNDVKFTCTDYSKIEPNNNDFLYLDPPYANTKGMYNGAIDNSELFEYLRKIPCKFALSFDGKGDSFDFTYNVPSDVYKRHLYVKSGNSSFRRIIRNTNDIVYESLYLNY